MKSTSPIIDSQNNQTQNKQMKRWSWSTKILVGVGIVFLLGMVLIIMNACLVIGTAGLDLALTILGGMLMGTLLLTLAICALVIMAITRAITNMSVKVVGATYYDAMVKPWIIAILRGLLALIAWKIAEWAKGSQPHYTWQPGPGWTTTSV